MKAIVCLYVCKLGKVRDKDVNHGKAIMMFTVNNQFELLSLHPFEGEILGLINHKIGSFFVHLKIAKVFCKWAIIHGLGKRLWEILN
jgi:hypothetical protein